MIIAIGNITTKGMMISVRFHAIHDRMPVILPPSAWEAWLSPELQDGQKVRELVSIMPA